MPRLALCLVVASGTDVLHSAAFGTPEDAWAACAEVSAQTHVTYLDRPWRRVLSIMPEKYEDIWTAAKGFYKLEPVVADGGELVLYAPHITQVSVMHPHITEIGYHNRDYFTGQWERFRDQPWGDLAHSTHLRGQGTWDPEHGERNRVTVTLATGIPREVVESVNLQYLDPRTIDVEEWAQDPDTFVEPHAGEVLYRLREEAPVGARRSRANPTGGSRPKSGPRVTRTALVVMGVAGCGKSTVAGLLADRLGWPLGEADDWHPAANVAAMTAGIPLTDADRAPWLLAVRDWIDAQGGDCVLTCSALRRSYRTCCGPRAPGCGSSTSTGPGTSSRPAWPPARGTSCRPRCSTPSSPRSNPSGPTRTAWSWDHGAPAEVADRVVEAVARQVSGSGNSWQVVG